MAAAARSRTRPLKIARALAALAVAGIAVPNVWVGLAARGHDYTDPSSVPARTVAIVPGATVSLTRPMPTLEDRLDAALALYRGGRVRSILVSGNDSGTDREVTIMRDWLLERGVPAGAIWSDDRGSRTRETMLRAAQQFQVQDAVVCTQAPFLPRALFLAQQAGIDAVGVALPTRAKRSTRQVGTEALKTTLAFAESFVESFVEPFVESFVRSKPERRLALVRATPSRPVVSPGAVPGAEPPLAATAAPGL